MLKININEPLCRNIKYSQARCRVQGTSNPENYAQQALQNRAAQWRLHLANVLPKLSSSLLRTQLCYSTSSTGCPRSFLFSTLPMPPERARARVHVLHPLGWPPPQCVIRPEGPLPNTLQQRTPSHERNLFLTITPCLLRHMVMYAPSTQVETKGRVNTNMQDERHQCDRRGVRSKCHICEDIICGSDLASSCSYQLQGVSIPV